MSNLPVNDSSVFGSAGEKPVSDEAYSLAKDLVRLWFQGEIGFHTLISQLNYYLPQKAYTRLLFQLFRYMHLDMRSRNAGVES